MTVGTQTTFDFSATGRSDRRDRPGRRFSQLPRRKRLGRAPAPRRPPAARCGRARLRAESSPWPSTARGRLVSATDGDGNTVSYCYFGQSCADGASDGGSQDLYSATPPGGATTTYGYDSSRLDRLPSTTTSSPRPCPAGGTVTNTYNSSGQVASQDAPSGDVTLSYSGDNQAVSGGSTVVSTWPAGTSGGLPAQEVDYQYSSGALVAETTGYGTSAAATEYFDLDPTSLVPTTVQDGDGDQTARHRARRRLGRPHGRRRRHLVHRRPGQHHRVPVQRRQPGLVPGGPGRVPGRRHLPVVGAHPRRRPRGQRPRPRGHDQLYNSAGQLTAATDALGQHDDLPYTSGVAGVPDGLQYCSVDPVDYQAGVTCPAYGAAHVTGTTTATFDSAGDETSATDADGNTTTYAYDAVGPPRAGVVVDQPRRHHHGVHLQRGRPGDVGRW